MRSFHHHIEHGQRHGVQRTEQERIFYPDLPQYDPVQADEKSSWETLSLPSTRYPISQSTSNNSKFSQESLLLNTTNPCLSHSSLAHQENIFQNNFFTNKPSKFNGQKTVKGEKRPLTSNGRSATVHKSSKAKKQATKQKKIQKSSSAKNLISRYQRSQTNNLGADIYMENQLGEQDGEEIEMLSNQNESPIDNLNPEWVSEQNYLPEGSQVVIFSSQCQRDYVLRQDQPLIERQCSSKMDFTKKLTSEEGIVETFGSEQTPQSDISPSVPFKATEKLQILNIQRRKKQFKFSGVSSSKTKKPTEKPKNLSAKKQKDQQKESYKASQFKTPKKIKKAKRKMQQCPQISDDNQSQPCNESKITHTMQIKKGMSLLEITREKTETKCLILIVGLSKNGIHKFCDQLPRCSIEKKNSKKSNGYIFRVLKEFKAFQTKGYYEKFQSIVRNVFEKLFTTNNKLLQSRDLRKIPNRTLRLLLKRYMSLNTLHFGVLQEKQNSLIYMRKAPSNS